MIIDEEKTWALTNFRGKESKRPAVKSDHNVLKANFCIKYKRIKIESRKTIFSFDDKGGMKIFNWLSSQKGCLQNTSAIVMIFQFSFFSGRES